MNSFSIIVNAGLSLGEVGDMTLQQAAENVAAAFRNKVLEWGKTALPGSTLLVGANRIVVCKSPYVPEGEPAGGKLPTPAYNGKIVTYANIIDTLMSWNPGVLREQAIFSHFDFDGRGRPDEFRVNGICAGIKSAVPAEPERYRGRPLIVVEYLH